VGDDTRFILSITTRPAFEDTTGRERSYRLEAALGPAAIADWTFSENGNKPQKPDGVMVVLRRDSVIECKIPLAALDASQGTLLGVRFSVRRGQLPLDTLPPDGLIELQVVPQEDLTAVAYAKP